MAVESALLDVRVLPWRPRARVMKPDTLRDALDPMFDFDLDLVGVVVGLVLWLVLIIAAPLVVLVLAVGLLSIELPIAIGLGVLLLVVRFSGVLPWTVVVLDQISGAERRETYRNLWRAVRRIRAINSDQHVNVRWAWV